MADRAERVENKYFYFGLALGEPVLGEVEFGASVKENEGFEGGGEGGGGEVGLEGGVGEDGGEGVEDGALLEQGG